MRPIARTVARLCLVLFCLLMAGCPSGNELGGVWRSVESDGVLIYDSTTGKPDIGIEIQLGHYGLDIAGVMRFYRTRQYDLTRDATNPYFECACTYMRKGRYGANSKTFEFIMEGCLPGSSPASSRFVRGSLRLEDNERLVGSLTVDDTSTGNSKVEKLVLSRHSAAGSVLAGDFACERTTDADAGNIYSGR